MAIYFNVFCKLILFIIIYAIIIKEEEVKWSKIIKLIMNIKALYSMFLIYLINYLYNSILITSI